MNAILEKTLSSFDNNMIAILENHFMQRFPNIALMKNSNLPVAIIGLGKTGVSVAKYLKINNKNL